MKQRRSNPYSTHRLWDEQTFSAYVDMPKNALGHNDHLSERSTPAHEERWRKWCAKWPKHLWPLSVDDHIARKARKRDAA